MRRAFLVLFFIFLAAVTSAEAQVSESATARQFTITAGAMGSLFSPNDKNAPYGPGAGHLYGAGTYVDFHFTHWFQVEGEARWLRIDPYYGENQDHYLIGPKVPLYRVGRAQTYGKVMIGLGKMTFPYNYGYGSFTALAYGGGLDYKLSKKLTVRALDFEFQQWPKFLPGASLDPYGVSVGIGYKVF
ncbi:MAG TPA: outer membrane beta-barrel protein [Terracidiphilus sp.]